MHGSSVKKRQRLRLDPHRRRSTERIRLVKRPSSVELQPKAGPLLHSKNLSKRLLPHLTLEMLEDEACRRSLREMIPRVFRNLVPSLQYKPNWHIDLMCEYLEAVHKGEILRLIINMPPRRLKSLVCSIAFPAWVLGQDPQERILCASYAYDLSIDLSVKCRRILQSDWFMRTFPKVQFADDQNEKSKYETTDQGFRSSVSVGGSVMGGGGTYKILDDPIDPEGAYSDAERKQILRWLDETWSSRSDDPKRAREILIMQRVHVQDPTAHLMAQGGWTLVKMPETVPKSIVVKFPVSGREYKRKKGELLHEEYFGPDQVVESKKRLGPYGYSAQHQQEPVPMGGGRIKLEWFPRHEFLPGKVDETVVSLDTGYKKGNSNPSAALVLQRVGAQWYLARSYKDRWTYPELKKAQQGIEDKWHPNTWVIEDKASGISLIQDMKADPDVKGAVLPMEPESDKVTRMEVQLAQLAAGKVSLPASSAHEEWAFELEGNISAYPSPKEWDELDSLSQFLKWLRAREGKEDDAVVAPFSATHTSTWRSSGTTQRA